jgi:tetratricopeptide (TPR) repeat protein
MPRLPGRSTLAPDVRPTDPCLGRGASPPHRHLADDPIRLEAIELDPKNAIAHGNLGNALSGKKQLDEAIREFRRAIELDPKSAQTHCTLAGALGDKKELDEAIREYRAAIAREEWVRPLPVAALCELLGLPAVLLHPQIAVIEYVKTLRLSRG